MVRKGSGVRVPLWASRECPATAGFSRSPLPSREEFPPGAPGGRGRLDSTGSPSAARRLRGPSVPLAPRETAEGDEADQDDDQPDPKTPDDHQNDPDDDDDPAKRYPGDSSSMFPLSHAFSFQWRMPASAALTG